MNKQKILKAIFIILLFIILFAFGYWLGINYFEKLITLFIMWLGNG